MCPEIPVGDLAVEIVRESVGAESLLPGLVEANKIRNAEVGIEVVENEVVENFDVRSDGIGEGNVLDERDLFEDITGLVALMEAAVNDAK